MEANIKHVTIAIRKATSTEIQRRALNELTLTLNNTFIVAIVRLHSQRSDGSCEKLVRNSDREARNSNIEHELHNNNQRNYNIK